VICEVRDGGKGKVHDVEGMLLYCFFVNITAIVLAIS